MICKEKLIMHIKNLKRGQNMLELNNITKIFNAGTVDETTLFDNFSFKLEKGEFAAVIGSNGSGKTTL